LCGSSTSIGFACRRNESFGVFGWGTSPWAIGHDAKSVDCHRRLGLLRTVGFRAGLAPSFPFAELLAEAAIGNSHRRVSRRQRALNKRKEFRALIRRNMSSGGYLTTCPSCETATRFPRNAKAPPQTVQGYRCPVCDQEVFIDAEINLLATFDMVVRVYRQDRRVELMNRRRFAQLEVSRERAARALTIMRKLKQARNALRPTWWVMVPLPKSCLLLETAMTAWAESAPFPWDQPPTVDDEQHTLNSYVLGQSVTYERQGMSKVERSTPLVDRRLVDEDDDLRRSYESDSARLAQMESALDDYVRRLPERPSTHNRALWRLAWEIAYAFSVFELRVTKDRKGILARALKLALQAAGDTAPTDVFHILKPVVDAIRANRMIGRP
jgi:hypothetical protein